MAEKPSCHASRMARGHAVDWRDIGRRGDDALRLKRTPPRQRITYCLVEIEYAARISRKECLAVVVIKAKFVDLLQAARR